MFGRITFDFPQNRIVLGDWLVPTKMLDETADLRQQGHYFIHTAEYQPDSELAVAPVML